MNSVFSNAVFKTKTKIGSFLYGIKKNYQNRLLPKVIFKNQNTNRKNLFGFRHGLIFKQHLRYVQ